MFQVKQIKTGIIWRIIEVVGAEFFAFCSFLILTRLLAPEHFGVIALATILILVSQLILFQGVGEALVQREDINDSYFSSAFWMNLVLAATAALVLILASDAIAIVFSEPRFGPVLRAVAPLLLIYAASGILQAKLRRDLQLKAFALASIFATICGAAVAALMALQGLEVWSLVGQQWGYAFVSTAMFFIGARWLPKLFVSIDQIRQLAGFSFNTIGAAMLRFSLRQVDVLFLGFYLPSKQVGLYFLATRILNTVGQLTYYSIQKIGLPILSRLQNDLVRHHEAIISTFRLTCLVCLPIFLGMAMTADLFVPLVFGVDWTGSIEPFQILSAFSIFYALSLIANQILLSIDQSSTVLRLSILNALVFAAAIAYAAPSGIAATALAGGLANMAMLPVYFFTLHRMLKVDLAHLGGELLPILTAGAVMVAGLLLARHYFLDVLEEIWVLVISIILGVVLFCATVIIIRRDYVNEVLTFIVGRTSSKTVL
ncbi:MAG: lipopolysaccharide biosynthesis protein [Geminicoccaceae bacterium]